MKTIIKLSLALSLTAAAPSALAAELVLKGADIYPVSGAMIPRGTIVIRQDKIVALGTDVAIPKGAEVIDCQGLRITPGFIATETSLGLVEIGLERGANDSRPVTRDPIRAAVDVQNALNLRSSLIAVARRQGVTSAVTLPNGGLIRGRSAWIDLLKPGAEVYSKAVKGPQALHITLGEGGAASVGRSRTLSMLKLNEFFDDARTYRASKAAFKRNALYRLSTSRLNLEVMGPVLARQMPVIIEAHREADIRAALAFMKKQRLKGALLGVSEGWLLAKEIAASRVPVILNPMANLPAAMERRHAHPQNAARLAQAGVQVAFTARSSHNAGNLRFVLGEAVRNGVSEGVALAGATKVPAQIFGMERKYGVLERGKIANLVVWNGDPFEPSTHAKYVVIQGEMQPTDSRQTRLARKYIRRLGLADGTQAPEAKAR